VDSLVKQRLVGALILAALAVVFWPIIFVQKDPLPDALIVDVPPAPPIDRTPLREPDTAGLRVLGDAQAQADPVPDVEFPASEMDAEADLPGLPPREETVSAVTLDEARETLTKPELDADGLPIAFSLQVATMGNPVRAEALRDELVEAGYKGYLKRLRRDDKVLYRVLVGPKYQRDELLPIKEAVDSAWRVDSLIIRYLP